MVNGCWSKLFYIEIETVFHKIDYEPSINGTVVSLSLLIYEITNRLGPKIDLCMSPYYIFYLFDFTLLIHLLLKKSTYDSLYTEHRYYGALLMSAKRLLHYIQNTSASKTIGHPITPTNGKVGG